VGWSEPDRPDAQSARTAPMYRPDLGGGPEAVGRRNADYVTRPFRSGTAPLLVDPIRACNTVGTMRTTVQTPDTLVPVS
jgi:hypothetical protein